MVKRLLHVIANAVEVCRRVEGKCYDSPLGSVQDSNSVSWRHRQFEDSIWRFMASVCKMLVFRGETYHAALVHLGALRTHGRAPPCAVVKAIGL